MCKNMRGKNGVKGNGEFWGKAIFLEGWGKCENERKKNHAHPRLWSPGATSFTIPTEGRLATKSGVNPDEPTRLSLSHILGTGADLRPSGRYCGESEGGGRTAVKGAPQCRSHCVTQRASAAVRRNLGYRGRRTMLQGGGGW